MNLLKLFPPFLNSVFFFYFLFAYHQPISAAITNPIDVSALKDFYFATGSKLNWTLNSDPCIDKWPCISCTTLINGYYYISGLFVAGQNLNGTIPDSIGNLSYLWNFNSNWQQPNPNLKGKVFQLVYIF